MAAVPNCTNASAPARPVSAGPGRPAATILRFPPPRGPIPVAADPSEGAACLRVPAAREIAAAWAVFLGLAILGLVLL